MGNVAILVADNSGSVGRKKKELALNYFNSVVGEETDKCYIGFGKTGVEYNSAEELLEYETQGGTYVSSGLELALDILLDLSVRDIRGSKVVITTDGDNWCEDNDSVIAVIKKLIALGVEVEYVEIKMSTYTSTLLYKLMADSTIMEKTEKFKVQRLQFKPDYL